MIIRLDWTFNIRCIGSNERSCIDVWWTLLMNIHSFFPYVMISCTKFIAILFKSWRTWKTRPLLSRRRLLDRELSNITTFLKLNYIARIILISVPVGCRLRSGYAYTVLTSIIFEYHSMHDRYFDMTGGITCRAENAHLSKSPNLLSLGSLVIPFICIFVSCFSSNIFFSNDLVPFIHYINSIIVPKMFKHFK